MKNKKKLIIIAVSFLLIGFIIIYLLIEPVPKDVKAKVLDNLEDYEKIAKICMEDFLTHDIDEIMYRCEEDYIYWNELDVDKSYKVVFSEDEKISYQSVKATYDELKYYLGEEPLDALIAYDTFVSFANNSIGGSIVYSSNDTKPPYVNGPGETLQHVTVKKIADNWYYAYSKNRGGL